MFIGRIKGTNRRVSIDEAIESGNRNNYVCPVCGAELIVKNGKINEAHFAHKTKLDCETFTSDVSEWHRFWQNVFPKNNQEIVLKRELTISEYNEAAYEYDFYDNWHTKNGRADEKIVLQHRADVLACGYVLEFQHSPISNREFNERNWFYISCGYKVIWIFDAIEEYERKRITCTGEWTGEKENGGKYKWKYAMKTLSDFVPQDHKPQYCDDGWWNGDIILFLQMNHDEGNEDDCSIERVTWAYNSFKNFGTSYYPGNSIELLEWVKNRKL